MIPNPEYVIPDCRAAMPDLLYPTTLMLAEELKVALGRVNLTRHVVELSSSGKTLIWEHLQH